MGRHVHNMKPEDESGMTHRCTSCAFRCTSKAVAEVNASPNLHHAIKKRKGYITPLYKGSR